MIIGENNRPQDLELNICKTKQLTNMRSAGAEELDTLQSPVDITLERALEYIGPDEMLEVTPDSIRIRKIKKKKKICNWFNERRKYKKFSSFPFYSFKSF